MSVLLRIMYWKEIPVQIQAKDTSSTVSRQLEERFQKAIDSIAMYDGSAGSDEYLNYWGYGDYKEINKDLNSALDYYEEKYNSMPQDFVKKIVKTIDNNSQDESHGAIDHWLLK